VTRQERKTKGEKGKIEIKIKVKAPERIKLTLHKVDQDLFKNLSIMLGDDYFSSFSAEDYLSIQQINNPQSKIPARQSPSLQAMAGGQNPKSLVVRYAKELLPTTEHNPIVVFHLRPHVKFHDGQVFDAHDVKFTYEAIMNPKNLSPRVPDYEPVKRVDVVDPLTVRIVYKRLYSPALGTWGMGILPEHLLNDKALGPSSGKGSG
jgi:ABC-type transport system substrate-binding protein